MNVEHRVFVRDNLVVAQISGSNNVTSQHTYIGGYQTCALLISKNCAQLQVLQMQIPRKYLMFSQFIFYFKHVIGTIEAVESGMRMFLVSLQ
jgi:hypothetical protein